MACGGVKARGGCGVETTVGATGSSSLSLARDDERATPGVAVIEFDATESPFEFTAFSVIGYAVPSTNGVVPSVDSVVRTTGEVVCPGESAR